MQILIPQKLSAIVLNSDELIRVGVVLVLVALVYGVGTVLFRMRQKQLGQMTKPQAVAGPAQDPIFAKRPNTRDPNYLALPPEEKNWLTTAVFEAAEVNRQQIPDYTFSQSEQIAKGAEWLSIVFYAEGLEWALGHWDTADFRFMEQIAKFLGLTDIAALIDQALVRYQATPDPSFGGLPHDDPQVQAHVAYFNDIEERVRAMGGVALIYEKANAYLDRHYHWST